MPGDVTQFDRFAAIYDLVRRRGADPAEVSKGLERARRPIERVLDVGGGPGRTLESVDGDLRVVLDPARGMLQRAQQHGIAGVLGDGGSLPVRTDSVDAILVTDALHHMADQEGVVAEAARALRPGGVLVVLEFDPTTVRGQFLAAAEHTIGFDSTFRSSWELLAMLESAGFSASLLRDGFQYTIAAIRPAENGSSKSVGSQ